MTARARYKVTQPGAPRRAADPMIETVAREMLGDIVARTPHGETGNLAAGWKIEHGRVPAAYVISNDVRYTAFVEYGGKHGNAQPMAGPVMAEFRARVGAT